MWLERIMFFAVLCCFEVNSEKGESDGSLLGTIVECLDGNKSLSCIANRAAKSIERATNNTIFLSQSITLARNEEPLPPTRQARNLNGLGRLLSAISNFIDTHSFSIDLTEGAPSEEEHASPRKGGGSGGEGGFFNMNKKALQRERKYYQYAFMVLLGIFGLTGPLVMKILGIMAAQSLLASKAALIIVGSVALKKIFENGGSKPKVKVTTLSLGDKYSSEEEHDRLSYAFDQIPHGYGYHGYAGKRSPFSGYFKDEKSEFAPVFNDQQKPITATSI